MALTDSFDLLRLPRLGGGALAAGALRARLTPCLPGPVRRALARRDRRLEVLPDAAGYARLALAAGDNVEPVGELALAGRDPLPAAALAATRERGPRPVLRLPADAVLTRRASLPAQIRENLAQAARLELDRLSPFTADQVLYDYRILAGAKGDPRIVIELALARRDGVEPWLKRLREAGAPAAAVAWEGAWDRANLLPPADRPRRRPLWREPLVLLALPLLLLGAAALATPLWQKTQILAALKSEVARARTQAIQVDELRQELERARAGSTAVLERKWKEPRMVALLRELTDRIPDDTWVQSLEYQQGEVQLRGESGQATALIAILEGAPGIQGVSFRSPITQVARTGQERFNLAFQYQAPPATGRESGPAAEPGGAGVEAGAAPPAADSPSPAPAGAP